MFDKQTAPKELINSHHYYSILLLLFPQFSSSASLFFNLLLSRSVTHLVSLHLSSLSHSPLVCLPVSPLSISTSRCKLFPSVIFKFFLSFPFPLSTTHPPSILYGQLSPVCLSSNMTSVSFSPEKKGAGAKVSKRILSSQLQALFPHPLLHYS